MRRWVLPGEWSTVGDCRYGRRCKQTRRAFGGVKRLSGHCEYNHLVRCFDLLSQVRGDRPDGGNGGDERDRRGYSKAPIFRLMEWEKRGGRPHRAVTDRLSEASHSYRHGSITLTFIERRKRAPRSHGQVHVKRVVGCQAVLAAKCLNVPKHPFKGSLVKLGTQGREVMKESASLVGRDPSFSFGDQQ